MRVFSAMQPTSSSLHLGNYLGALINWPKLQNDNECIYCIVNQHAITMPQNPSLLRENTYKCLAQYIASGIDPCKSIVFKQSDIAEHSQLAWVLSTITPFGAASRMTQFKDKSQKQGSASAGVGLFIYPMLMAADILLYKADIVPVGQDQKQHIELAQTLAEKFNNQFAADIPIFKPPSALIDENALKIYDLKNPNKKMSKSSSDPKGIINLMDENDIIRKKIMSATTDMFQAINFDREKQPGISNLLTIYAGITEISLHKAQKTFASSSYADFKKDIADAVISHIEPIRDRTFELLSDISYLDKILETGAEKAGNIASVTLKEVYKAIGF